MSSIDRFKAAAEGAKTNRDYVSGNKTGSSSTSLKQLIANSYAELEATADEVDRSTSDSSSSSNGSSWLEITSAAITGIASLATAYATVKGATNKGNGTATTKAATPQTPAGQLDALTNSVDVTSKKGRQKLEKGIADAKNQFDANETTIDTARNEKNRLEALKGDTAAMSAEFTDTVNTVQGQIATSLEAYETASKNYDTAATMQLEYEQQKGQYEEKLNAALQGKEDSTGKKIDAENKVSLIDCTLEQINATFTETETQKAVQEQAYYEATTAQPGLDANYKKAVNDVKDNDSEIKNQSSLIKDYDKSIKNYQKDRNKSNDDSVKAKYDAQISSLESKKSAAMAKKDAAEAKKESLKAAEKEAKAKKEHNEDLIKDLKNALGETATKIDNLQTDLVTQKDAKETALASVETLVAEIDKYVNVADIASKNTTAAQEHINDAVTAQQRLTLQQAEALTAKTDGEEAIDLTSRMDPQKLKTQVDAKIAVQDGIIQAKTKENIALQKSIQSAYTKLGVSAENITQEDKKYMPETTETTTATPGVQAPATQTPAAPTPANNGDLTVDELDDGSDVLKRANNLKYKGSTSTLEGVSDIKSNGDGTFNLIYSNGSKKRVNADGSEVK